MARTSEVSDPVAHFETWAYRVDRHHWENLGLVFTLLVDRAKTAELRKRLKEQGMKDRKERAKHAIHRRAYVDRAWKVWGSNDPSIARTVFAFNPGYVFLRADGATALQVIASSDKDLEVCERIMPSEIFGRVFHLSALDLALHLRSGCSIDHYEIPASQVKSETMRLEISRDQRLYR